MPGLTSLTRRAGSFEPRGRVLDFARILLALAQLSILAASPSRVLFLQSPGATWDSRCAGINAYSLWCVSSDVSGGTTVGMCVAALILVAVAIGLSPRILCVPHWYVTFSLGVDIAVPNGGDAAAEILALLLIPMCLGDPRTSVWQLPRGREMTPHWRGSSYAAHLVLRLQVSGIYLQAAISKLLHPAWRHGVALQLLANDPSFGVTSMGRGFADTFMALPAVAQTLTYGALLAEFSIGAAMWFGPRYRRVGFAIAVAMHGAIILIMGLFSFGLVMIACVLTTCAGRSIFPDTSCRPGEGLNSEHDDLPVRTQPMLRSGAWRMVRHPGGRHPRGIPRRGPAHL